MSDHETPINDGQPLDALDKLAFQRLADAHEATSQPLFDDNFDTAERVAFSPKVTTIDGHPVGHIAFMFGPHVENAHDVQQSTQLPESK